jgi:hypothetical protein
MGCNCAILERETRRERTVAWNGTKTRDEGYFEAAFADDPCKAAILHICPFKLFSTRTTTVLEGTSNRHKLDILWSACISKDVHDALKIAQLSEKRASRNDRESYPKTPNGAT